MRRLTFVYMPLLVICSLVLSACNLTGNSNSTVLTASGTIASREVRIAPQIGGEVASVNVEEGQQVSAGDELFRLDNTLLVAQRNIVLAGLETAQSAAVVADAAVASAQAQYDATVNAALNADRQNRTGDWLGKQPAGSGQSTWYFGRTEQLEAARANVTAAQQDLDAARTNLSEVVQRATSQGFSSAEQDLINARLAYEIAGDVLQRAKQSDSQALKDEAQALVNDAQADLDATQRTYDRALTTEAAANILKARGEFRIAQERYDTALDYARGLETGLSSPQVVVAAAALAQAQAAAEQAQSAIGQAQANLASVDAQIEKTVVTAPTDGYVLAQNLEVGEMLAPGGVVITIGQLQEVELVVYIPEAEYGRVDLGDEAEITVDSFPDETFLGAVVHISDKAEFTPRNVQTVEGRRATAYAVKLLVPNLDLGLKPGMPADVTFPE